MEQKRVESPIHSLSSIRLWFIMSSVWFVRLMFYNSYSSSSSFIILCINCDLCEIAILLSIKENIPKLQWKISSNSSVHHWVSETLAFGVLQYPLDQNRVLGYPLCHQQNAFWDAEPPHDTAAHEPLSGTHGPVKLQAVHAFKTTISLWPWWNEWKWHGLV